MNNPMLERIITQETLGEILDQLSFRQLAYALLRLQGLNTYDIAHQLGLTNQAVSEQLARARSRLSAAFPELTGGGSPRSHAVTGLPERRPDRRHLTGEARTPAQLAHAARRRKPDAVRRRKARP